MDSKTLFILACIPARLSLAFLAIKIPKEYLNYWAIIVLSIGIGFLYLFFTGKRKTGIETGGRPIWWANFRIFHGLMYTVAGIFALNDNSKTAFQIILADTIVGLGLFINKYFIKMNLFS